MSRQARHVLSGEEFLSNKALREIAALGGILADLDERREQLVAVALRGRDERACLVATFKRGEQKGVSVERVELSWLCAADRARVRQVFERTPPPRPFSDLIVPPLQRPPAIIVPKRPDVTAVLGSLRDLISDAQPHLEPSKAILALANLCGVAAALGQGEVFRDVVWEMRAKFGKLDGETDPILLRSIRRIVAGAGMARQVGLAQLLVSDVVPSGELSNTLERYPDHVWGVARSAARVIASTDRTLILEALFGVFEGSYAREVLTAATFAHLLDERGSGHAFWLLRQRIGNQVATQSTSQETPIYALLHAVAVEGVDASPETIGMLREMTSTCFGRSGIEAKFGELAGWLFGCALGQRPRTEQGIRQEIETLGAKDPRVLQAIMRGILSADRGRNGEVVSDVLNSDLVRGAIPRMQIGVLSLMNYVMHEYQNAGCVRTRAHDATLEFCRVALPHSSREYATSFVKAALHEALMNSSLPVNELRDEVSSALLRVVAPQSLPTGLLSSDSSVRIFPEIDKQKLFPVMKKAGKIAEFITLLDTEHKTSTSEWMTLWLYELGAGNPTAGTSPKKANRREDFHSFFSSPTVNFELTEWCRLAEAAAASSPALVFPILERVRQTKEPGAAYLASEAVLAGTWYARKRRR